MLVVDTRVACPAQAGGTDNMPIADALPRPAAIPASPRAASAAPNAPNSPKAASPPRAEAASAASSAGRRPPPARPISVDVAEAQFPAPMLRMLPMPPESSGGNNPVVAWMMADASPVIPERGEAAADELSDSVTP
ncbi:Uncharacterised protein [Mycobacterium tuberculosis]|nr:Uncharacterised protein [Mycobacterium tuberculosis]